MGESMRWEEGFIAIDWGTTNRRAYRIDQHGKCVDEFEDHLGVLSVAQGGFPDAVAQIRQRLGNHPLLLAGMVGSNRGWKEVPYIPCPAGIDELARNLVWVGKREAIVPGVSYLGAGRADVMRGEEVQLVGAVAAGLVDPVSLVCHPGTHNKWAMLRHGAIHSFTSVMTGELFSLLKDHSILSELLQGPVGVNEAFRRGVRQAMERDALPADLFGVRAQVLLGQGSKDEAPSYASGLLIGTDVRIGLTDPLGADVTVIGRPDLTALYAAAVSEHGRKAVELDGERCFLAGIQEIAKRI
jgi:2-dehydro-3-deoxygalactonokinase